MELEREALGPGLHQVGVPLAVGVLIDGAQVGFAQGAVVHLAVHEEVLGGEIVLHHKVGDGVKELGILVPVGGVLGEGLGVALDVLGDGVGAVIPHIGVVLGAYALHAHLVHLGLAEGPQGGVGAQGLEVGGVLGAVVDHSVVVRGLDAHHLQEGALVGAEGQGLGLVQLLGVVVVLLRTGHQLVGHGGVVAVVLVEVEHPLQAGQPVVSHSLGLLVAAHVHPCDVVAELEGPGQTAVLTAPLLGPGGHQLSGAVALQQGRGAGRQDLQAGGALGAEDDEGLQLAGSQLPGDPVGQGLGLGLLGRCGLGGGSGFRRGGRGGAAAGVLPGIAAVLAAGGEDHHDRHQHRKKPCRVSLHCSNLLNISFQISGPAGEECGRRSSALRGVRRGTGLRAMSGAGPPDLLC